MKYLISSWFVQGESPSLDQSTCLLPPTFWKTAAEVLPRKLTFVRLSLLPPNPSLGWTYWPILVIPVPLASKFLVISRWKSQNIPLSRTVTSDVQKLQINWSDFLSHSKRGGHFYRCLGLARDIWEHGNEFLLSQSDKSLLCWYQYQYQYQYQY